jgi:hypothetical protein
MVNSSVSLSRRGRAHGPSAVTGFGTFGALGVLSGAEVTGDGPRWPLREAGLHLRPTDVLSELRAVVRGRVPAD